MQPRPCRCPFARNRGRRDAKDLRSVFDRKSSEESELDNTRLLLIEGGEPLQCVVEHDDIEIDRLWRGFDSFVDCHFADSAPALGRLMAAGVFDKDLSHNARGHSEEVGAILPVRNIGADKTNVGFVNEGRALQCVTGTLALQVMGSYLTKFVVDERKQIIQSLLVSASPTDE